MRGARCLAMVVVALLLVSVNGYAGGFVKLDGIEGESTDDGHKDWIDVLAWSWGIEKQVGQVGGGGGTECSRAYRQDLVITKPVDSTSPLLVLLAEGCDPTATVTLEVAIDPDPSGKPPVPRVMRITLTDVLVTKVEMGSSGGDDVPTENVTLNYAEVRVEVKEVGRTR